MRREGCSGLNMLENNNDSSSSNIPDASNKANPVTILVPHLNLETNNCTFS
jgi:hypothetical protein